MSSGCAALQLTEEDVTRMLVAGVHLGAKNQDKKMESYVYKKRPDGVCITHLKKTWEKILLAARMIVAIENPADVCVLSTQPIGTRAVLKFAFHTGASPIAGRFTPGTFSNQIQKAFKEPRLLVVTDPKNDHQAVMEASYVNVPVIAFCNTDAKLDYVDCVIPCNNASKMSIGLMWWMLAREVLCFRGIITRNRNAPWDVKPDLYFFRDAEDLKKEEESNIPDDVQEPVYAQPEFKQPAIPAQEDWTVESATDWSTTNADDWTGQAAATTGTSNWADDEAQWNAHLANGSWQ